MSGTIIDLLLLFAVAAVCGLIAMAVIGRVRGGGCLAAVGIGFIGAVLGLWLSRVFGLPDLFSVNVGGHAFPLVWAIIGAILVIIVLRLIRL